MRSLSLQLILKRALLLFGAAMVTAILIDVGLKSLGGEESGESTFASLVADDEHRSPGKPQPQVDITSELHALGGDVFEFAFALVPQEKCEELAIRVRGLRGVELVETPGGDFERLAQCSEGISSSVRVRIPTGVSGLVVVDIQIRGSDKGVRSVSRAFPAANSGVVGRMTKTLDMRGREEPESPGRLEKSGSEVMRVIDVR